MTEEKTIKARVDCPCCKGTGKKIVYSPANAMIIPPTNSDFWEENLKSHLRVAKEGQKWVYKYYNMRVSFKIAFIGMFISLLTNAFLIYYIISN